MNLGRAPRAKLLVGLTVLIVSALVISVVIIRRSPSLPSPGRLIKSPDVAAACAKFLPTVPAIMDGVQRSTALGANPVKYASASVLACGVQRPADLIAYSQFFEVGGATGSTVNWLANKDNTTFTAVDRSVFIAYSVHKGTVPDLPTLSAAISKAFPQICTSIDAQIAGQKLPLCTSR